MKFLVAGWFSFEQMGATAGDLIAKDLICARLQASGIPFDVAFASPFTGGVDWQTVNKDEYTDVVFVCGPFGNGWPVNLFLERFSGIRLYGLNLSMLQPLEEWDPFRLLIERDSSRCTNPDITFLGPDRKVPVVGLIKVHLQKEYGSRSMHRLVDEHLDVFLKHRPMAIVPIDTSLIGNGNGFTTPEEVESLIAKMDLVVTTRLHGTVLSLKNGIPVIPIDPIRGGAKISLQVKELGWPLLFLPEDLGPNVLSNAFAYCLTDDARRQARECGLENRQKVKLLLDKLMDGISASRDEAFNEQALRK